MAKVHEAEAMVHEVEEDPAVFVATGYPFDMPPPGSTLWAWTIAQFRWTCACKWARGETGPLPDRVRGTRGQPGQARARRGGGALR